MGKCKCGKDTGWSGGKECKYCWAERKFVVQEEELKITNQKFNEKLKQGCGDGQPHDFEIKHIGEYINGDWVQFKEVRCKRPYCSLNEKWRI